MFNWSRKKDIITNTVYSDKINNFLKITFNPVEEFANTYRF